MTTSGSSTPNRDPFADTELARLRLVADLPGRLRKQLIVPAHQVALVGGAGRQLRLLKPGAHTVAGPWSLLNGQALAATYVLLPATPLSLRVTVTRLAGDGEPANVRFLVEARIARPVPFYAAFLERTGRVSTLDLQAALAGRAEDILAPLMRDYAAEDLSVKRDGLLKALRERLPAAGSSLGLDLSRIDNLAAIPALDLVEEARRIAEVENELRRVAQDRAMDSLAGAAQMQEFVRQIEAEFGLPGLAEAVSQAGEDPGEVSRALREAAESRVATAAARQAELLSAEAAAPTIVESEPGWLRWIGPVRIVLGLLSLALIVYSVLQLPPDDPEREFAQLSALISGVSLLLLVVSTAWYEVRTRRRLLNQRVMGALDMLSQGSREQADELLRRQVVSGLQAVKKKLSDARLRIHKHGYEDEAIALREVENRVERMISRLGQAQTARPPYLTKAHVSAAELAAMLSYDEELMLQMNRIDDTAQKLLAQAIRDEHAPDDLVALEVALTELEHAFDARARFLRTPVGNG